MVSKFKQNKVLYADIYKKATRPFTNHPVCAAEDRDLFIEAQPTLPKTEGNGAATTPELISALVMAAAQL